MPFCEAELTNRKLQLTLKRLRRISAFWRKPEYMMTKYNSFIFERDATNKVLIAGNHLLYRTFFSLESSF